MTPSFQGYSGYDQYPQMGYGHYPHRALIETVELTLAAGQFPQPVPMPHMQQWVQPDQQYQPEWQSPNSIIRSRSANAAYDMQGQPPSMEQYDQHQHPMFETALPALQLRHASSPSMFGQPATPRSFAMQQHALFRNGAPSPRTAAALSGIRGQPGEASLVSPRDDAAPFAQAQGGAPPQLKTEGDDGGMAPTEQPRSATRPPGSANIDALPMELAQQVTFEPDAGVQYIYLDPSQAQDHALIESIRAQGFGVSFSS